MGCTKCTTYTCLVIFQLIKQCWAAEMIFHVHMMPPFVNRLYKIGHKSLSQPNFCISLVLSFIYVPVVDITTLTFCQGPSIYFPLMGFFGLVLLELSSSFEGNEGFIRGVNHERKSRTHLSEIQNEIRKSFENPGNLTNPSST